MKKNNELLCLMIGNSRLHWGWFKNEQLIKVKNTAHFETFKYHNLPLYIASVVPNLTEIYLKNDITKLINLCDIPLKGIYATMGIDRVLAVFGAGIQYGFPSLVIDCGTALTFTGVSGDRHLQGGAILPGLGLQLRSLSSKTAALPVVKLPEKLPELYAKNTEDAIISGVVYNLLAGMELFINSWLKQFPNSNICITGGDSDNLLSYFSDYNYQLSQKIIKDQNLIFWGMKKAIENLENL